MSRLHIFRPLHRTLRPLVLTLLLLILGPASSVHASLLLDGPMGGFAGKVTDLLTGQPVSDVTVSACRWEGASCTYKGQGSTKPDGTFEVRGLMPGKYRVCFSHSRYLGECYDDQPPGSDGTRLTIEIDELVTDVNAALLPRGSIRGRATDEVSGAGVEGITVTAMGWRVAAWTDMGKTTTGPDGRYDLPLEAGSYKVRSSDPQHLRPDRYYAAPDGTTATVGLGTGQIVEGIDLALPLLGQIAGQVTRQATGEPLSGIAITVSTGEWNSTVGQAVTDGDGRYEVGELNAGQYFVEFADPSHTCAYAITSPPVTVTLNATTTVDRVLLETGALVGAAVDASTNAPLEGITVELSGPNYGQAHTTGADGRIVAQKLDPGVYWASLGDPAGRYQGVSPTPADAITVTAGMTTTVAWSLKPIPPGPRVSRGQVTDAVTGAPLPGIRVDLEYWYDHWLHPGWETAAMTVTNAVGEYEFVNPPYAERLYFSDPAEAYGDGIHDYQDPGPGQTAVNDIALTANASKYGRITGRVVGSTGEPFGWTTVEFIPQGEGERRWPFTDDNGVYSQWLPPGAYLVHFNGQYPFEGEYYADATTPEDAQQIVVRAGEVITVNATLTEMGRIAGRITDSEGLGVKGAWVYLRLAPDWLWGDQVQTDADGWYLSPRLGSGTYHVQVFHGAYETLVYGGGTDLAKGQGVVVTAGRTTTGVDLALVRRGAVAGHVFDAQTDEPVAGIKVEACGTATTGSDGAFLIQRVQSGWCKVTFSDPQGRYPVHAYDDGRGVQVVSPETTALEMRLERPGRVTGHIIAPGIWGGPVEGAEVRLSQGSWSRTLKTDSQGAYDSGLLLQQDQHFILSFRHPSTKYEPPGERQIVVRRGEALVEDAIFDIRGDVTGSVTDAVTGAPVNGIFVYVYAGTVTNGPLVYTGGNGGYYLNHLLSGAWTITFGDCCRRYVTVTRPITITVNTTLEGVDAALSPWGAIVGRVTDEATGEGIPRAWVTLYRADGDAWARVKAVVTAGDGMYSLGGLDAGAYRLEFSDPRGAYRPEVYGDARSLAEGQDVTFAPGADTVADAALERVGEGEPGREVWLPLVVGE